GRAIPPVADQLVRIRGRVIRVGEAAIQVDRDAPCYGSSRNGQVNWSSGGSRGHVRRSRVTCCVVGPHPVIVGGARSDAGILVSGDTSTHADKVFEVDAVRGALNPKASGITGIRLPTQVNLGCRNDAGRQVARRGREGQARRGSRGHVRERRQSSRIAGLSPVIVLGAGGEAGVAVRRDAAADGGDNGV